MSDIVTTYPLLAAAPLDAGWADPTRLPLAVLPCLSGAERGRRGLGPREEP